MTASATLEVALYGCAVILGAVLRLLLLDARPLSVDEGTFALQSYGVMLGRFAEPLRNGPLPTYGVAATLALFGGGDGAARLFSVIPGSAVSVAPWFLRASIGRAAGVVAAWGFALSPILLLGSRTVGSDALIAVLALALWWACGPSRLQGWWRALSVAVLAAALLTSGPSGLTAGGALGLAALLSYPDLDGLSKSARSVWSSPLRTSIILIFIGAMLVISTGFGVNLRGIQYVLADSWSTWFGTFTARGNRGGALPTIAMYELPALLLAVVGVGITLVHRRRTDLFLALWAVILLLTGMVQSGTALSKAMLAVVPIYLLASRTVASSLSVARGASSGWRWRASLVAASVPVFVAFGLLNRASKLSEPTPVEFIYGEAGLVLAAISLLAYLPEGAGRRAILWYGFAALSVAFIVHSAVFLNYRMESAPSEPVVGQQISPELRRATTEAVYYSTYFDATVRVDPQLRGALAWYLRGAPNVEYSAQQSEGISILLAPTAQAPLGEGSNRIPGVFTPAFDGGLSWRGAWGWVIARNGLVRPNPRDIILRAPSSAL
ncbi:MAG TPA: hypothetical protein VF960_13440 [Chloroflexota bacterium]